MSERGWRGDGRSADRDASESLAERRVVQLMEAGSGWLEAMIEASQPPRRWRRAPGLIARTAALPAVQLDVGPASRGPLAQVPAAGLTHRVIVNVVEMRPAVEPLRPGAQGTPAPPAGDAAIDASFAQANRIYNPHGLQVVMGARRTVDGPRARTPLAREERAAAASRPHASPETRRQLAAAASAPEPAFDADPSHHRDRNASQEAIEILRAHGTRGRVTAFWVPSVVGGTGMAVDDSFYRNLRGVPEGVFVARGAGAEVFAHELGHVLMGIGHTDLDASDDDRDGAPDEEIDDCEDGNLMQSGSRRTGTELTPAQVGRLLGARPYVEPIAGAAGTAQRAVAETSTPGLDASQVRTVAEYGLSGATGRLPFVEAICTSFGRHDVSGVRTAIGGPAAAAADALGAHAYASGDAVAFAREPDLFLAAHEAAHVVQQRDGVQLADGLGRAGDRYEQHADEVAAAVVRGESAEAMLDRGPDRGRDPARPVQRAAAGAAGADAHEAAVAGVAGAGAPLPHLDAVQRSFGRHDVRGVQAHVGGAAAVAADAIGAGAYATGNDVAFAAAPDLRQTAHEAAHVIQQRAGVQLDGGFGRAGDSYERHADAVAERVTRGESAQDLLDGPPAGGAATAASSRT